MRSTSNIAKFFIVCAVVFGIGLLTAALGAAFGGIDDFGKVAEKREWIQGDPGKQVKEYVEVGDFDKVEIEGSADVNFITKEWCVDSSVHDDDDPDWIDEYGSMINEAEYKPGKVLVIRGSKVEAPEIKVEKGVLHIKSEPVEFNGISLNFSSVSAMPGVFVYCTDEQLKSIKAESTSGDLSFMGVSFRKASIESMSGDVFMKDVTGKELALNVFSGDIAASGKITDRTAITSESGDIRLSGRFLGETVANVSSGDFSYSTAMKKEKYEMNLRVLSGDVAISVGPKRTIYEDEENLNFGGDPNKLMIKSNSGDIELSFSTNAL